MYDCDCGISAADCHHAHLSDEYEPRMRVIDSKFAPALAGCVR